MGYLKSFWTPCYYYDDARDATWTVAAYTALFSALAITYTAYVMLGGESATYYMPYFHTDIRNTTQIWGSLAIVFFLLFIVFSYLAVRGIRIENRGLILPWMICMMMVILYQFYYGLIVLYQYYIYLSSVMITLVSWMWMAYNIYCYLCIYSEYQVIREKQSPQIIFNYV